MIAKVIGSTNELQSITIKQRSRAQDESHEVEEYRYGDSGLFDTKKDLRKVTVEMLDIPELHYRSENGKKFMQYLADKTDRALFEHQSIQRIINFQWNQEAKQFVYWFQVVPFLLQLALFLCWHLYAIENMDESEQDYRLFNGVRWSLVALCVFFLLQELIQCCRKTCRGHRETKCENLFQYFNSAVNIIDLVSNILILFNCYYVESIRVGIG